MKKLEETVLWLRRHRIRFEDRWIGTLLVAGTAALVYWKTAAFFVGWLPPLIASAVCASGVGMAWHLLTRLPSCGKDKVGLVLAIQAESNADQLRVRKDFVGAVRDALRGSTGILEFQVLEVPRMRIPEVFNEECGRDLLLGCGATVLFWGSVQQRRHNGEDHYVIRLEGGLKHPAIPKERSATLAREVRAAVPSKIVFPVSEELRGFESTSTNVVFGARYIAALANVIAKQNDLALNLLGRLLVDLGGPRRRTRASKAKPNKDIQGWLRNAVQLRLAALHLEEYRRLSTEWLADKANMRLLEQSAEHLESYIDVVGREAAEREPNFLLGRAMTEVALRENWRAAIHWIDRCRQIAPQDAGAVFSRAFLSVLQGKPEDALRQYETALRLQQVDFYVNQIEEFVHWWYETKEKLPALLLLSALLNAKGKPDHQLALEDLRRFELTIGPNTPAQLVVRAAKLRQQLEKAPRPARFEAVA